MEKLTDTHREGKTILLATLSSLVKEDGVFSISLTGILPDSRFNILGGK